MSQSIHGHEVMEMMLQKGGTFTKESLETAMREKFGPTARYHTCSAENMTASELINFLDERGKFTASQEGFQTHPAKICGHS